jgi:hypothetical protein
MRSGVIRDPGELRSPAGRKLSSSIIEVTMTSLGRSTGKLGGLLQGALELPQEPPPRHRLSPESL